MSREVILKRMDLEHDRFKLSMHIMVILTSGLAGLLLKGINNFVDQILFMGGVILNLFVVAYLIDAILKSKNTCLNWRKEVIEFFGALVLVISLVYFFYKLNSIESEELRGKKIH